MKFDQKGIEGLVWEDGMSYDPKDCGIVIKQHRILENPRDPIDDNLLEVTFTQFSISREPKEFFKTTVYGQAPEFYCFKNGILVDNLPASKSGKKIHEITAAYFDGTTRIIYSGDLIKWSAYDEGAIVQRISQKSQFGKEKAELVAVHLDGKEETIFKKAPVSWPHAWKSYSMGVLTLDWVKEMELRIVPPRIRLVEKTRATFHNVNGNKNNIYLDDLQILNEAIEGSKHGLIERTRLKDNNYLLTYKGIHGQEIKLYEGYAYKWQPCGDGVAVKYQEQEGLMDISIYNGNGELAAVFKREPNADWRAYG